MQDQKTIINSWKYENYLLSQVDFENLKTTILKFLDDQLPHSIYLDFQIWDWTQAGISADLNDHLELYGIFIGICCRLDICKTCPQLSTVLDFVIEITNGYLNNPYHNSGHAFDVAYMVYYSLDIMSVSEILSATKAEKTALILSALGHDIEHPGLNNMFQVFIQTNHLTIKINAKTQLAIQYQNISVLENHSLDLMFSILEKFNVLQILFSDSENYENDLIYTKELIKSCILNTDMVHHFPLLDEILGFIESRNKNANPQNIYNLAEEDEEQSDSSLNKNQTTSSESILETMKIDNPNIRKSLLSAILHAADISNPARPFEICKAWSDMVGQEFFNQGEQERILKLPLSPNMDRHSSNQIKNQIKFSDFIVKPFYECLAALFPKMQCFIDLIIDNARNWESLQNIESDSPVEDIAVKSIKKQASRKFSMAAGTVDIPDMTKRFEFLKQRSATKNRNVTTR